VRGTKELVTELLTASNLRVHRRFAAALALRNVTKITTVSVPCVRRRLAVAGNTSSDFPECASWQRSSGVAACLLESLRRCARTITLRNHSKSLCIVQAFLWNIHLHSCTQLAQPAVRCRAYSAHASTLPERSTPPAPGFSKDSTMFLANKTGSAESSCHFYVCA
jgi:hypothetical protein